MVAFKDITGSRFGRLVVVRFLRMKTGSSEWACICDCGTEIQARGNNLRSGHTSSCGCHRKDSARNHHLMHGHNRRGARSSTYHRWSIMKDRCLNPRNKQFRHYGGRGITVCERWLIFKNFLADMGEARPASHSTASTITVLIPPTTAVGRPRKNKPTTVANIMPTPTTPARPAQTTPHTQPVAK